MPQVHRSERARENSVGEKWTESGTRCRALLLPTLPPNRGRRQEPYCPIQSATDQPVLTAAFLGHTTLQVRCRALKAPRGQTAPFPQRTLTVPLREDVGALAQSSLGRCLAMLEALLLTREENDSIPTCHPAEGGPHPSFGHTARSSPLWPS